MALAIQSLGRLHVAEPVSQLIDAGWNAPHVSEVGGAFDAGRAAERLFCRHAVSRGLIASLVLHPLSVASHLTGYRSLVASLASLAGRALAWLEIGALSRYEQ